MVAVLDFAMIMVLNSSYAFMIISCSSAEKKEAISLSLFAIVLLENHGFGDRRFPLLKKDGRAQLSLVRINKIV